jgi:hypothetical protein
MSSGAYIAFVSAPCGTFRAFGSGARAEVRSEKDGGGWPLINTNGNGKKSSMSSKTNGTVYFAFYFAL